MTDLTAAVEAAARAEWEQRIDGGDWDALDARHQRFLCKAVHPLIAAAAPILRAQVLAEAREAVGRELSWAMARGTYPAAMEALRRLWGEAGTGIDALGAKGAR